MKLIDRYIYTVTRHLPEPTRADVAKELRTNIEAMLSEDPTPDEIEAVLKGLGNPWLLASEYQPNKRYLIGPNYFDNYVTVLKLVIAIVATVVGILTVVAQLIDPPVQAGQVQLIVDTLVSVFAGIFNGIIQAIFWVTVVFVILERTGGPNFQAAPDWNIADLPEEPIVKLAISRVEAAVEITLTIFFTGIILMQPQLIGYFSILTQNGIDIVTKIPLFHIAQLQQYTLLIIVSSAASIFVAVWKFMTGQWNLKLIIGNAVGNAVAVAAAAVILLDPRMFNYQFYEKMAQIFQVSPLNAELSTKYMAWIVFLVIALLSAVDTLGPLIKWVIKERQSTKDAI